MRNPTFAHLCFLDDQKSALYHYNRYNLDPKLPIPHGLGLNNYDRNHIAELFSRLATPIPFHCCTLNSTHLMGDVDPQLTLEESIVIVVDAAQRLRNLALNADGEPRLKEQLDQYITVDLFRQVLECIVVAVDQKQHYQQQHQQHKQRHHHQQPQPSPQQSINNNHNPSSPLPHPSSTTTTTITTNHPNKASASNLITSLILALTKLLFDLTEFPMDDHLDTAVGAGIIPVTVMLLGCYDDDDKGGHFGRIPTKIDINTDSTMAMVRRVASMILYQMLYQHTERLMSDGTIVTETVQSLLMNHHKQCHNHRHDHHYHHILNIPSQPQPHSSLTLPYMIKYLYSGLASTELEVTILFLERFITDCRDTLWEDNLRDNGDSVAIDTNNPRNQHNKPLLPLPLCFNLDIVPLDQHRTKMNTNVSGHNNPRCHGNLLIALLVDILSHQSLQIVARGMKLFATCLPGGVGYYEDGDDNGEDDHNNDENHHDDCDGGRQVRKTLNHSYCSCSTILKRIKAFQSSNNSRK